MTEKGKIYRFHVPVLAVDCGTPPKVTNAAVKSGATIFQSEREYICAKGYTGGGMIRCQSNRSWTESPQCKRKRYCQ